MDIDQGTATALGFPKPHYINVERERRWLCERVPTELIVATEQISDLYVTGARLRLTRKADVDRDTRLISSIYLTEDEFDVLALCQRRPASSRRFRAFGRRAGKGRLASLAG